jgi:membrane-associated phospholipid phosphatase
MSPDVRLAASADAFAQHHDRWEDAARAYAQLSEPLFIAGVVLLAAAALAASRVLVSVHYPNDVLAGALLGTAAALLVCFIAASVPGPFARRRTGIANAAKALR